MELLGYQYIGLKDILRIKNDVILETEFKQALSKLNPWLSQENSNVIFNQIKDQRSSDWEYVLQQ